MHQVAITGVAGLSLEPFFSGDVAGSFVVSGASSPYTW